MKILLWYLLTVNALGSLLMLADKLRAKKNKWRIRESTLLGCAAIGGSVGVLLGMHLFRHKTLHSKFTIGVPLILAAQVVLGTVLMIVFK